MSDLTIAPHERGVIRLLALGMGPEEPNFRDPGTAGQDLGAEGLDPEQIVVFSESNLEDPGLCGHPGESCDVSVNQLNCSVLETVKGRLMVLCRAAFGGQEATLSPDPHLRLIDTYIEEATNWTGETIKTESAKPFSTRQNAEENDKPFCVSSSLIVFLIVVTVGGSLWQTL